MSEASVSPALASAADFQTRFPSLVEDGSASDPAVLADIMVEATAAIEDQTTRRLAPFTSLQETHPLFGVDPDEYGAETPGMPLPWAGSLGVSYADALGVNSLVRKCWLREFAPRYPELWSYTVESITLMLSVGGSYVVNLQNLEGPWPDSGMMRFQIGTFAPEGTTAVITYSGGYQTTPPSLKRACLYQAAKHVILDMEPQFRKGMDLAELDTQITQLISPWVRA